MYVDFFLTWGPARLFFDVDWLSFPVPGCFVLLSRGPEGVGGGGAADGDSEFRSFGVLEFGVWSFGVSEFGVWSLEFWSLDFGVLDFLGFGVLEFGVWGLECGVLEFWGLDFGVCTLEFLAFWFFDFWIFDFWIFPGLVSCIF